MPRTDSTAILATVIGLLLVCGPRAAAIDAENRPIAAIEITGLSQVSEQLVRNSIRSQPGEPYRQQTVDDDVTRITHLGRFTRVTPTVGQEADGSIVLVFEVVEAPLLADVQVVGNKAINDQKLLDRVRLCAGDPADPFLIENGVRQISDAYEEKGHFVASVEVDQKLLTETSVLIYRIREGPRIRIVGIEYRGNVAFTDDQLKSEIRSETYFPIVRKGNLSRDQLDLDAAAIRRYYQDNGYIDARCEREIQLSPDSRKAVVVFIIDAGPRYIVDRVRIEGESLIFQDAQIVQNMTLVPGSIFSGEGLRESRRRIAEMYGRIGFIETTVVIDLARRFEADQPLIDLLVRIDESTPYLAGKIEVTGNDLTRKRVVLREVRGMDPGRRFDSTGIARTEQRLRNSSLFTDATVTILGDPDDEVRDVLIEVKEGQTGSIGFGLGLSSDAGVGGSIDLVQRNFDITDWPESLGEFITGRAFRGAGQYFALTLQPGNERSLYSVTWQEPYFLESDFFLNLNAFYFQREFDSYDEERISGTIGVGRRFGDTWTVAVNARFTPRIDITDIDLSAPLSVVAVAGESSQTSMGFSIIRDSTDNPLAPSEGSRVELSLERTGVFGGDYDFTTVGVEYQVFWTVYEDFLGRKTIVSWRSEVGYIFSGNAPVFDRLYAGGQRSFRGFEFRGVGPRGIRSDTLTVGDDAVGGDWLFLTSLQYEFPILDEFLRGVVFTDQGTVQRDVGFDQWRVSVGAGIRLRIPFLSQAPLAIDVAVPIIKEPGDQEQIIGFDLDVPLR